MHVLMSLAVLLGEAGSFGGEAGANEGAPGPDEGFRRSLELPELAYPGIAAGIFLLLLLVVFAFRSTSKRH